MAGRRSVRGSELLLAGDARSCCSYCGCEWAPATISYLFSLDLALLKKREPVEKVLSRRRVADPATMEFLMQPINSTTLLEVNQNNIPMSPLHYPVMTPPLVKVSALTASSADAQLCAPEAAPGAGSAEKPQGPGNSIEHVDLKTLGSTKRCEVMD